MLETYCNHIQCLTLLLVQSFGEYVGIALFILIVCSADILSCQTIGFVIRINNYTMFMY